MTKSRLSTASDDQGHPASAGNRPNFHPRTGATRRAAPPLISNLQVSAMPTAVFPADPQTSKAKLSSVTALLPTRDRGPSNGTNRRTSSAWRGRQAGQHVMIGIPSACQAPPPPSRSRTRHRPATPRPAACSCSGGNSRRAPPDDLVVHHRKARPSRHLVGRTNPLDRQPPRRGVRRKRSSTTGQSSSGRTPWRRH
jgi:hypothetical protein